MFYKKKNFAKSKVAVAPSPSTSGTELTVTTGEGDLFPAEFPFRCTAWPPNSSPLAANAEIIYVTNRVGDVLTIERAKQDTDAQEIGVDWNIANTITIDDIKDIENMAAGYIIGETPGGTINGSNTAFTVSLPFATGSLRIYRNGIRLREGADNDYQISGQGFTLAEAPAVGAILVVDYNMQTTIKIADGSVSWVVNEVPAGLVNGSNALFTLASGYVAGSLMVFRDGQLMNGGGNDYTETSAVNGTFTFVTAPETGSVILVTFKKAISVGANADCVDGIDASVIAENGKLAPFNGGWNKVAPTFAYSSADDPTYVMTTNVDLRQYIYPGIKLEVTQGSNIRYFICTASIFSGSTFTCTMYGGTDYDLANATIDQVRFSGEKAPYGFPLSPIKWSVEVNDTGARSVLNPTVNVWYNIGQLNLVLPIGIWNVEYIVGVEFARNDSATGNCQTTFGSANNNEIPDWTQGTELSAQWNGTRLQFSGISTNRRCVSVAAKTTMYFNMRTKNTGITAIQTSVWMPAVNTTRAVCAYL